MTPLRHNSSQTPTTNIDDSLLRAPISRRTLLRSVVGAFGAAGVASILAACGSSSASTSNSSSSSAGSSSSSTSSSSSSSSSSSASSSSSGSSSAATPATSSTQASSGSGGTPKQGGTITFGRSGDSDTLDPQHTTASISWQVFTNIYDTLTALNMSGEPEGILAEKWEISPDGKQYTFHLRQGINFHDGTPFNADAVKFTYDRLTDPKTNAPAAAWISGYESANVVDEHTVVLQLKAPFSPFMGNSSIAYFGILSPTAVNKEGANFGHHPVGTGPFMFKEWVPEQTITLVRNPNYKNFHSYVENKGAPYIDSLVFQNIPEAQTQISAFETDQINLLAVPPHNVSDFQKNKDYHVFLDKQSTSISFVEFNMVKPSSEYGAIFKPPFDDLRVRQAVAYAIDPDAIIKSILYGLATRNYGPMPAGLFAYDPKIEQYGYQHDLSKAEQLLDEAGWKSSGGGTRKKGGQSLDVEFWTSNSTTSQQVTQVIQNQLTQAGFNMKIVALEVATFLGRLGTSGDTSNFDYDGWGWSEPDVLYMMSHSSSGVGYYEAEAFQKPITEARLVTDHAKRTQLYFQASQAMLKDCAIVPLWSSWSATATGKEVKGFKLGPQGYYAYLDAYIDKS